MREFVKRLVTTFQDSRIHKSGTRVRGGSSLRQLDLLLLLIALLVLILVIAASIVVIALLVK